MKNNIWTTSLITIVVILVFGGIFFLNIQKSVHYAQIEEKVYVALEGEGKIAVIDSVNKKILTNIDLSKKSHGTSIEFMSHNVQVSPDGKSVWVTANAMHEDKDSSDGHGSDKKSEISDEVIVINPNNDRIIKRISISPDSHLAHVVISPDNSMAYVALQEQDQIYAINTKTYAIEQKINFDEGSGPHGLRVSPDGSKVFIALLDGKALAILDTAKNSIEKILANSEVVQTAVTPDGKYVFATLYSTKQIMRLDTVLGDTSFIDLPEEAQGPLQIYATPDSRYLYIADQGYYFDQPQNNKVYRLNIEKSLIDQTILVGDAPHWVVVDAKGKFVYITNLLSNDVSIIDISLGKEIFRLPVGEMPNGISIWNQ